MHKKFEINRTKIKVSCQSGRKVIIHDSKNDLPLVSSRPSVYSRKVQGLQYSQVKEILFYNLPGAVSAVTTKLEAAEAAEAACCEAVGVL